MYNVLLLNARAALRFYTHAPHHTLVANPVRYHTVRVDAIILRSTTG